MKQILKKLADKVSSFSQNKKRLCLGVLLFSVIGIILPLSFAQANLTETIVTPLVFGIFKVIFQLLLIFPTVILGIVTWFLTLVVSPTFIDVSYTNNAFVIYGWTITKNLANIGFIIILAFIGLGTALRIQEYQWQKTLPRLFFILLIINFTPVICGFIIDASNIVINYFLNGAMGWAATSDGLSDMSTKLLEGQLLGTTNITELASTSGVIIVELIAIMLTMWMAIFIYCLFMILFLARYVMLWVLVILSPIAFFTYVFKESHLVKTIFPGVLHWEEWWNNFLQWSVIGVVLSFFLFLSNSLAGMMNAGSMTLSELPSSVKGAGVMNELMPYIVNLALLVVGFMTAIKTAPMGAGYLTGKVKGVVRSVARGSTKVVLKTTGGAARVGGRALKGGASKIADNTKAGRNWKKRFKKIEESETMKKARYYIPGIKTPGEKARGDEEARSKHEKDYKKRGQAGHIDEVIRISKDHLTKNSDERAAAKNVVELFRPELSGRNINKVIGEHKPKEAVANYQNQSLRLPEVVMGMDVRKIKEFEKNGSTEQIDSIKEAMAKTTKDAFDNTVTVVEKEIDRLERHRHTQSIDVKTRAENLKKLERLVEMVDYMNEDSTTF